MSFNGGSIVDFLLVKSKIVRKLRAANAYEVVIGELPTVLQEKVAEDSKEESVDNSKETEGEEVKENLSVRFKRTINPNSPFSGTTPLMSRSIPKCSPVRKASEVSEAEITRYENELRDWKKRTANVYQVLEECLGQRPMSIIRRELDNGDLESAWLKLNNHYISSKQTGISKIIDFLSATTQGSSETITEFAGRLEDLFNVLKDLDTEWSDSMKLDKLKRGILKGPKGSSFQTTLESIVLWGLSYEEAVNALEEKESYVSNNRDDLKSPKILFSNSNNNNTNFSSNSNYNVKNPSNRDNGNNICRFYQKGICTYGSRCKFKHIQNEKKVQCNYCHESGHLAQECPQLIKRNSNIVISKSAFNVTTNKFDESVIFLDTCATVHIVSNKDMIQDIRESASIIELNGIGGSKISTKIGNFLEFGEAVVIENGPNLLSVSKLKENNWKLSYDDNLDLFTITKDNTQFKFTNSDNNALYSTHFNIQAYEANLVISKESVETIHKRIGHINEESMIKLSELKGIDCKVEDIREFFKNRNCIHCQMGFESNVKARSRSERERCSNIGDLIHIDIFFLLNVPFLICVDDKSRYVNIIQLEDKSSYQLLESIKLLKQFYEANNFKIKLISSDSEKSIISIEQDLMEIGIKLSAVGPYTHEKVAESNIKQIKIKVRTIISEIQFNLPKKYVKFAVIAACKARNITSINGNNPAEFIFFNGINKNLTKYHFGQCLMAYVPNPKNDLSARSELVMVLNPEANGVVKVWVPSRKEVVRRYKFKSIIINKTIIDLINNSFITYESIKPNELSSYNLLYNINNDIDNANVEVNENVNENENENENVNINELSEIDNEKVYVNVMELSKSDNGIVNVNVKEFKKNDNENESEKEIENESSNTNEFYENVNDVDINYINYAFISEDDIKNDNGENQDFKNRAIYDELKQLYDYDVFDLSVDISDQTTIPAYMIVNEKFDAEGNYIKHKARLVAGGNFQIFDGNTKSNTIKHSSLMIVLNYCLNKSLILNTIDIKGAFLHANLSDNIWVKLKKNVSDILISIDNKFVNYTNNNGELNLKLKKALYGLKQASLAWYSTLKEKLMELGYMPTDNDPCLFKFKDNLLSIHVDDILCVNTSLEEYNRIKLYLIKNFKEITCSNGNKIQYLGVNIEYNNDIIKLDQSGYICKIIKKFNINDKCITPSDKYFFKNDENNKYNNLPLNEFENKKFLKMVMSLMYLSVQTRPDIAKEVSYMSTKINKANNYDMNKLIKIFKYLNNTMNDQLIITKNNFDLKIYIDASFNSHIDAKGLQVF